MTNDIQIYGKLNRDVVKITYDGGQTESISVMVDNKNNVISAEINSSFVDSSPQENSENLITSGAVFEAIFTALNTPV